MMIMVMMGTSPKMMVWMLVAIVLLLTMTTNTTITTVLGLAGRPV